ncbi:hypothetical protein [Deinococcus aquatilis]|uniref:hypothetical protein n=1 Tax=Deinococcus aquatilis TaxID=519440 RepID=UPI00037F73A5|nr:hypothetical protein [Deinococcus aquatilis]
MNPLEAQRKVTLSAILHTQHVLARSPFPEAQVFAGMMRLLETASKSTSISELRVLQDEADAEAGGLSLEGAP